MSNWKHKWHYRQPRHNTTRSAWPHKKLSIWSRCSHNWGSHLTHLPWLVRTTMPASSSHPLQERRNLRSHIASGHLAPLCEGRTTHGRDHCNLCANWGNAGRYAHQAPATCGVWETEHQGDEPGRNLTWYAWLLPERRGVEAFSASCILTTISGKITHVSITNDDSLWSLVIASN